MSALFKKLLAFIISAKELVSIVLAPIPAAWAYWQGLMEGYPPITQLIFALAIFALTAYSLYHMLHIVDFGIGKYGARKDRNDAADKLEALLDTGTRTMTIGDVANIWSGGNLDKVWVFNPRLKRLKRAVKEGKIKKCNDFMTRATSVAGGMRLNAGIPHYEPNMNMCVQLDSVITALRNGDL